ncbi:MAG TPA: thrombospondin type 3 repeat-containing protein [bacterium]|nr:thrombospondin type 3 repeat-containing protein [bacterium]
MFNRILMAVCVAAIFFLAVSANANAACTVTIGGIDYVDTDCDGMRDAFDNCPLVPNGDCEEDPLNCDVDVDGVVTDEELAAGDQADWNANGKGDACEDTESDGVLDYLDNCPSTFNPGQADGDCSDMDGDRVEDGLDSCPAIWNPRQEDTDGDGFGDACDVCPLTPNPGQDPSDCPAAERNPVSPTESPSGSVGRPGVVYEGYTEQVTGSGGCALSAGAGQAPWAVMTAAAAFILGFVRRRIKE